jgi:hypothetical protein
MLETMLVVTAVQDWTYRHFWVRLLLQHIKVVAVAEVRLLLLVLAVLAVVAQVRLVQTTLHQAQQTAVVVAVDTI